jgi:hypothetical protein
VSDRRAQLLISVVGVVPAVLAVLHETIATRMSGQTARWQDMAFTGGDWLVLGLLTPLVYYVARRFSLRRIGVHFIGALVFSVAWATLGLLLGLLLHHYPAIHPIGAAYLDWILVTVPFGFIVYFTACYFINASRLSAQLTEARLGALRMQLHPHFLYNSLNTVLVLVREKDTAGAARMLELLGDGLRHILQNDRPHEVPLDEELRFLEQYLAIEQVRFSDRLRVEWSIDERARETRVPDLILQPLVENAIRHGVSRRAEGGMIEIGARIAGDFMELFVRDDGAGIETAERDGVGLSNTKARLQALYGDAGRVTIRALEPRGTEVLLRIPFRT